MPSDLVSTVNNSSQHHSGCPGQLLVCFAAVLGFSSDEGVGFQLTKRYVGFILGKRNRVQETSNRATFVDAPRWSFSLTNVLLLQILILNCFWGSFTFSPLFLCLSYSHAVLEVQMSATCKHKKESGVKRSNSYTFFLLSIVSMLKPYIFHKDCF